MLKVNCNACGAPYDVDPRRIPPNGLKMRCPSCGTSILVKPDGTGETQAAPTEPEKSATKFKGTALGLGAPNLDAMKAKIPEPAAPGKKAATKLGIAPIASADADLPAMKATSGPKLGIPRTGAALPTAAGMPLPF